VANTILTQVCMPSIWSPVSLASVSKFQHVQSSSDTQLARSQENENQSSLINLTELAGDIGATVFFLNKTALPLSINFNPFLVTFCLFLRALIDVKKNNNMSCS